MHTSLHLAHVRCQPQQELSPEPGPGGAWSASSRQAPGSSSQQQSLMKSQGGIGGQGDRGGAGGTKSEAQRLPQWGPTGPGRGGSCSLQNRKRALCCQVFLSQGLSPQLTVGGARLTPGSEQRPHWLPPDKHRRLRGPESRLSEGNLPARPRCGIRKAGGCWHLCPGATEDSPHSHHRVCSLAGGSGGTGGSWRQGSSVTSRTQAKPAHGRGGTWYLLHESGGSASPRGSSIPQMVSMTGTDPSPQ